MRQVVFVVPSRPEHTVWPRAASQAGWSSCMRCLCSELMLLGISTWSDDGIVLFPDFLVLLYSYLGQPDLLLDILSWPLVVGFIGVYYHTHFIPSLVPGVLVC